MAFDDTVILVRQLKAHILSAAYACARHRYRGQTYDESTFRNFVQRGIEFACWDLERTITLIDTAPSLAAFDDIEPIGQYYQRRGNTFMYCQIRKLAAMKGFPVEEIDATIRRPDLKCLADIVHTFGLCYCSK